MVGKMVSFAQHLTTAPKTLELLTKSASLRELFSSCYSLIVVDEAQIYISKERDAQSNVRSSL